MNIEIMRNTLYKAYLEDFYKFCQVYSTRDGGFDDVFSIILVVLLIIRLFSNF
jgi:vacuolar-type H+-ATPase subunit C/Vma6